MEELLEEIQNLAIVGLYIDGAHHKQYYLERILFKFIEHGVTDKLSLDDFKIVESDEAGEEFLCEWEEAIAP